MLNRVGFANRFDVEMFDGGRLFRETVEVFADAAVVVAFYGGQGLMAVFAERGAAVVEILPEDVGEGSLSGVRMFGLRYDAVRLAEGSRVGRRLSKLGYRDVWDIERVIGKRMKETVFGAR